MQLSHVFGNDFESNQEYRKMEDLCVQPYDWCGGDRDNSFSCRIWCHDKDSQRVLLRVEDYQPFCRLELPIYVEGVHIKWQLDSLRAYTEWLRKFLEHHAPTRIIYNDLEKLYLYNRRNRRPFLTCFFRSEAALLHCTAAINKKPYSISRLGLIRAKVWETGIHSVHRLVTDLKVGYGQWLKVKGQKVEEIDRISRGKTREYLVSHKDISPMPEDETFGYSTSPLAAGIDIECYSNNHKAMPNKLYIQDKVFMISYVTQILGDPTSKKKYLLVLGDSLPIEGAEIRKFDHEIALIDGLADLIQETDPSLLVGYNTYKFDYPYLDARVRLHLRDWKDCGLIVGQGTYVKTKTWKSSAYGFMTISTLEAEGRLSIDMFPIIKRDHKLDRYTLDFVSKHFLKRGKHDVSASQMFRAYRSYLDASEPDSRQTALEELRKIGDYNLEDSSLCIDLMEELKTWIALIETATVVAVPIMSIFTRGQQVRVQNQLYQYAYREGFVIDERPVEGGKFMGAYVVDPIPGRYRNVLIFDFASLYPNIIRAYNICYTTLVLDETIPDSCCHVLEWQEEEVKHRYRFIKQEYFHGILPRMCETLITARKAVRKLIGPQNSGIINEVLNQRQNALKVSANSIFGSLGVREGRLPLAEGAASITAMGRILSGKAGNYVREKYNGVIVYGDTDSIMVDLQIQDPHECKRIGEVLSVEISNQFPSPLKLEFERALAVALFIKKKKYAGVMMSTIEKSSSLKVKKIEEESFHPDYRNDDLRLWRFDITESVSGVLKERTEYIAAPRNIEMTPEQPYYSGIPLTNGVGKRLGAPDQRRILKKGIVLARRDNCIWLKEIYLAVMLNILFDKPMEETMEIINSEILRMMSRSVPFLKMSVTREIGSNYKPNSSYPLKLFSDELRRISHPIQGGDRIDYIFVRSNDPIKNTKQGYKMRLHEHFWQNYELEPLDCLHYVEKILGNPIDQIFYLGYKDQIEKIKERSKPDVRRRGKIYTYLNEKYVASTWVKMLKVKEALTREIRTRIPLKE